MKFFGPHRPERVLLRRNTLYATPALVVMYRSRLASSVNVSPSH